MIQWVWGHNNLMPYLSVKSPKFSESLVLLYENTMFYASTILTLIEIVSRAISQGFRISCKYWWGTLWKCYCQCWFGSLKEKNLNNKQNLQFVTSLLLMTGPCKGHIMSWSWPYCVQSMILTSLMWLPIKDWCMWVHIIGWMIAVSFIDFVRSYFPNVSPAG